MADEPYEESVDWDSSYDTQPAVVTPEAGPDLPVVPEQSSVQIDPDPFTDDERMDYEPFDRPDAQKFGIIGGKGAGKSYLFQSIVYQTFAGKQAGAMTYYLEDDCSHLFTAMGGGARETQTGEGRRVNRMDFIRRYQNWERLPSTTRLIQKWYRLRLNMKSGWLGRQRSILDIEFFDGSGEGLLELESLTREEREIWERAYLPATVMVFCLPLWAAFPNGDLTDADWDERERRLRGFEQVLTHYNELRSRKGETPVSTILALTMADDRRSALRTLYNRWIVPYLDSPGNHLKQLRKGTAIARYLNNARRISEALQDEFESARDRRISGLPESLNFGRGNPWIVPLSAIDGSRLDYLEDKYRDPDDPARLREARQTTPTPIHVELPLLVALCERENALV